jgi:hypothetical protein
MAATITALNVVSNPDVTNRQIIVDGTVALTGNYGGDATHGDTLDLAQLGDLLKSSQLPTKVEVWEDPPSGTAPSFAQFVYCPGTTQANGVVSIAVAGTELTQGDAYTDPVLSATLRVRAWFPAY